MQSKLSPQQQLQKENERISRKILLIGGIIMILGLMIFAAVLINKFNSDLEQSYLEGQKDALRGDVRIAQNAEGKWVFTKSPWDLK